MSAEGMALTVLVTTFTQAMRDDNNDQTLEPHFGPAVKRWFKDQAAMVVEPNGSPLHPDKAPK